MKMRKYLLKLIDEDSGATLQKLKLKQGLKYLVGRSKKADVVIADKSVKKKMLYVFVEEEGKTFVTPKAEIQINGVDVEKDERVQMKKGQVIIKFRESNYYLLLKERSKKKTEVQEEDTEEKEELETQIVEEEEEEQVESKKSKKDKKSKKEKQLKSQEAEEEEDEKPTQIKEEQNIQAKQQPTDKRKLLWGKKSDDGELEKKAQIYGKVEASSEETNKFFKLLGFKKEVEGKKVQVEAQNFFIKKSGLEKHSMMTNLEKQFNVSVNRKNTKGGLGMS